MFDRLLRPEIPPPVFKADWSPPTVTRPQELFGLFKRSVFLYSSGEPTTLFEAVRGIQREVIRIVMYRSTKKYPRWMPPSRVFFALMSEYTNLVYYQLFTSQVGIPAMI